MPEFILGTEIPTAKVGVYSEKTDSPLGGVARECVQYIAKGYPDSNGKKVLELGFGVGSLIPYLSNKFGEKVNGIDLREWFTRNEKILAGLLNGYSLDLPINSSSVDVVVSMYLFEKPSELKRSLEEVARMLIPGGEAVLVIPKLTTDEDPKNALVALTKMEVVDFKAISVPGEAGSAWVVTLKKK